MPILKTLTIAAVVLVFAISAAQVGLSAYIVAYYQSRRSANNATFTFHVNQFTYNYYWLPLITLIRSNALQLTAGVVGIIISAFVFFLMIQSKPLSFIGTGKRGPRTITWPTLTLCLSLLFFLFALPAIVVSYYDHSIANLYSIQSISICVGQHVLAGSSLASERNCGGSYFNDTLYPMTIEGWTCNLAHRSYLGPAANPVTGNARQVLPRTCTIASIARIWTIPLLISPILLSIFAFLSLRNSNIKQYQQKHSTAVKPQSTSVSSTTPLSPTGTLPQYTASELHSPRDKAEVGGKQVVEAPEKLEKAELVGERHHVYSELAAGSSRERLQKS